MAKQERHGRPKDFAARKHEVLTKKTPSSVASIADAVTIIDRDVFFVCAPDGNVPHVRDHGLGLYFHDCRYLSGYEVRLDGKPLDVLAAAATEGFKAIFQLTNKDLKAPSGEVPRQSLGIRLGRLIRGPQQALFDVYTVENFSGERQEVRLELAFEADFRDVMAIRGLLRLHPGQVRRPTWRDGVLTLAYDGKDEIYRALDISFSRPPTRKNGHRAEFALALEPGEQVELMVTLAVTEEREPRDAGLRTPADLAAVERALARASDAWITQRCRLETNAPLFNRIYRQAFLDLHALRMDLDGREFFGAGIPWFGTLFGRDSLTAAMQMLAFDPEPAEETLHLLACYQGRAVDSWRDEQPGKILHEFRQGELARLDEIPHTPYYGSIDATPLFLIVLAQHARWTGRLDLFETLRPNVEAALGWIEAQLGDGYLAYDSETNGGLVNQGWKDAGDSIVNADASLADPPIALAEVQGYVYAAWLGMADLFDRIGEPGRGTALRKAAASLKRRFNRDFWLPGRKFYALALQRGGRPAAVIASNAGQVLWTGIADKGKAACVARQLMEPAMFSGWGVRTLASTEEAYNPIAYHRGTVWPHDNALIAAGLRRYGYDDAAMRIYSGLFEAATHFDIHRMPEVFSGYPAGPFGEPVRFPVACHPQAWAAGSLPMLLVTMLGLEPDAFANQLRIRQPRLLDLVTDLDLIDLRIGDARVDLRFRKVDGRVAVEVPRCEGGLEVVLVNE